MRRAPMATIPGPRGLTWRAFAVRIWRAVNEHAATDAAAQLSYYALFSLFPFLLFLVTLTAWLPLGDAFARLMGQLSDFMPPDALALVEQQVASLIEHPRPHLLTAGLAVTLWSASRGVDAVRTALNRAYDVKESRPLWRTQLLAIFTTVLVAVLVLAAVALLVVGGQAGRWLAERAGVSATDQATWGWLRWPGTALVFMLAVALVYYLLPDVRQRFRYITPGSLASTALWLLGTLGFTRYVEQFGHYDVTYGSIGGVVVLMTWLYISGLVLVLGGELNAVLEQASPDGKRAGARAPGAPAAPQRERPSAMPAAAAKSAGVAAPPEPRRA